MIFFNIFSRDLEMKLLSSLCTFQSSHLYYRTFSQLYQANPTVITSCICLSKMSNLCVINHTLPTCCVQNNCSANNSLQSYVLLITLYLLIKNFFLFSFWNSINWCVNQSYFNISISVYNIIFSISTIFLLPLKMLSVITSQDRNFIHYIEFLGYLIPITLVAKNWVQLEHL